MNIAAMILQPREKIARDRLLMAAHPAQTVRPFATKTERRRLNQVSGTSIARTARSLLSEIRTP
jgi:hypothetical protein